MSVLPADVRRDVATPATLVGRHFGNAARISLDHSGPLEPLGRWVVEIGTPPVPADPVRWVDEHTLSILIPAGLAAGLHDVIVTTPRGRNKRMRSALRVHDEQVGAVVGDSGPSRSATSPDAGTRTARDASSSPDALDVGRDAASGLDAGDADVRPDAADTPAGCPSRDNFNPLGATLVHRYSFCEAGSVVVDGVGGEHGTLIGTQLDGSGQLTLTAPGTHARLPSGIISGLDDATIEVWAEWVTRGPGQRLFDFGHLPSLSGWELGDSFLFLTPADDSGNLSAALSAVQFAGRVTLTGPVLPTGRPVYLATVVDDVARKLRLYLDGDLVDEATIIGRLPEIDDLNDWLGRSQVDAGPGFRGSLIEVRIHAAALTGAEIGISASAGPDASF